MTTPLFQEMLQQGSSFLDALAIELKKLGFDLKTLQPDHLCLRVATSEEYESTKAIAASSASLLTETEVNGRPIASYRLHEAFVSSLGPVEVLEIPAPKNGAPYPTGFEHAEFVIHESFESFRAKHTALTFKGLQDRVLNPELSLKTSCGVAKFHTSTLARVIEIEEARVSDVIFDCDGTLIDTHHDAEFFPLFPGIREALTEISRLGFRLHIWTARDKESTHQIMKAHGIDMLFETLNCPTRAHAKPDPKSLGIDGTSKAPGSMIVVGDSGADMRGAQAIGAVAGAALWDPGLDLAHLCERGAELLLRRPQDLVDYLRPRAPKASRGS